MQFVRRVVVQVNLDCVKFHRFKYFGHNDKKNASRELENIKMKQISERVNLQALIF
jgi:hypothetical protein